MPAKGSQEKATNVIRNSMKCAFLTLSTQVIWNNQNTTIIGGYIGVYNAHNIYWTFLAWYMSLKIMVFPFTSHCLGAHQN